VNDDLPLWREYRQTRATAVRDRLVERHLAVVKYAAAWVAGRLPRHLRLEDLYAAGMLGFIGAIDDYDPDRGVSFAAYATPRVRGAILDELRRLDCVPRRVRKKLREIQRAMDALCQRLDREPTDEDVAAEVGLDVAAYRKLLGEGVTVLSLDTAALEDDEPGLSGSVEDASLPDPLGWLEGRELRRTLARIIDRLPERERQVLALYYYEELTMQEIGQVFGVTESRVSQIHSGAVLRLRAALARERLRSVDLGPAAGRTRVRPGPRR
jgi:RNA polymerase sigma factor for flagellar operon FliA